MESSLSKADLFSACVFENEERGEEEEEEFEKKEDELPRSRAAFVTRSPNRIILAVFYDALRPAARIPDADFNRSISFSVRGRNSPGGTSSVNGP